VSFFSILVFSSERREIADMFCRLAKGEQQESNATKSRKVRIPGMSQTFILLFYFCLSFIVYLLFYFFVTHGNFLWSPYLYKLTRLQRRKTFNKPRDATTAHGSTAAESVKNLLKKNPKYSKRINYDALKDLFVEGGGPPSLAATMGVSDEKDDAELYTFGDDKSEEGAPMVIIEDAGNVVPERPMQPDSGGVEEDADVDAEGEDASDDEKGDDQQFEWEYEQEV